MNLRTAVTKVFPRTHDASASVCVCVCVCVRVRVRVCVWWWCRGTGQPLGLARPLALHPSALNHEPSRRLLEERDRRLSWGAAAVAGRWQPTGRVSIGERAVHVLMPLECAELWCIWSSSVTKGGVDVAND